MSQVCRRGRHGRESVRDVVVYQPSPVADWDGHNYTRIYIHSCAHAKLVAQVFFLFFSSSFSSACLCNTSEKRVSTIELVYTMVGLTRRLEIGSKSR